MTGAVPRAFIAHRCPGRARLKFAAERGNADFFANLATLMHEAPGVIEVRANPLTASLLVFHRGPLEEVMAFAATRQWFLPSEEPLFAPSQAGDRDEVSIKGLATLVVAGLGVLQVLRGNVLGPATGLFAFAWTMLHAPADGGGDDAVTDA